MVRKRFFILVVLAAAVVNSSSSMAPSDLETLAIKVSGQLKRVRLSVVADTCTRNSRSWGWRSTPAPRWPSAPP